MHRLEHAVARLCQSALVPGARLSHAAGANLLALSLDSSLLSNSIEASVF